MEEVYWRYLFQGRIMFQGVIFMINDDILAGESKNIEFKAERPKDSFKYMKTVVAFSNGDGGKIIFGVDDKTRKIV